MATQLFLNDAVADTHLGTDSTNLAGGNVGWFSRSLATSRGSGVQSSLSTNTVTGPTAGIEIADRLGVSRLAEWISPPLAADVTIAGTITVNIWAAETDMNANVAINAVIDVIRANTTTTRNSNTIVEIARTARVTEVAITTRAVNNFTVTPTSTVVNRGDRLRVRVFGDDVGTMATGFSFAIGYSGTTAAVDGDTYVTFTETFTFESVDGLAQTARDSTRTFGNTTQQKIAQPFTAVGSTLTQVIAWLAAFGSPTDNIVVEIQGDSGGSPDGVSIGTVATVTAVGLTSTAVQFTWSCSIALTPSTSYWVVFTRSGSLDNVNAPQSGSFGSAVIGWSVAKTYNGSTWSTFSGPLSLSLRTLGSTLYLTNVQSGLTAAPTLVSSFTGSDENPLSEGGNWARINSSAEQLQRISNTAKAASAASANSYWTPTNFGADLEAYVTIVTVGAGGGINARVQGEGGANTWDGYRVLADGTFTVIQSVTNATTTDLIAVSQGFSAGDKMGMRIEGSTIQAWRQASGSGTWNLIATVVDTTYASAGKIGLYCNSSTVVLDDFYAATDSNLFTQQAWTSRGAGVVSYISDTDAGWVAPLLTNDWYTRKLTAFTLTGMAVANIRALESNASANASLRCQIARVDSDGTNPTVWANWAIAAIPSDNGELGTTEAARTCNVSGDDLAFTDGQRIRIRLYIDDMAGAAMGDAFNVQTFFNGTSAAASGDTYITLPQSVTEFVAGTAGSVLQTSRQRRASRFLTFR
jgi:hypothetical protein